MEGETVDVAFFEDSFEMAAVIKTSFGVHAAIATVTNSSKRHFKVDDLHCAIILDKSTRTSRISY